MFREASRFVSDLRQGKSVSIRWHQAPGSGSCRRKSERSAERSCEPPLAGRDADQLAHLQKSIKRLKLLKAMTEDGGWNSFQRKNATRLTAK
jgi:hypothetical protein